MAKAKKPKAGNKSEKAQHSSQHTWRVVRMNNQSVDVAADDLTVADGDLVFSTDSVTVRVIAANTYTDVELLDADAAAASAIFQNRAARRGR